MIFTIELLWAAYKCAAPISNAFATNKKTTLLLVRNLAIEQMILCIPIMALFEKEGSKIKSPLKILSGWTAYCFYYINITFFCSIT